MPIAKKGIGSTINVMVTVDEGHRSQLDSVAGRLAAAGLNVSGKFTVGGLIVGEVATDDLAKQHRVEGIKAIEEEPTLFVDR